MAKYLVRLERVKFTELEVEASSALMARHNMMSMLEDAEVVTTLAGKSWHDGGINVESAREVADEGVGNAERS